MIVTMTTALRLTAT